MTPNPNHVTYAKESRGVWRAYVRGELVGKLVKKGRYWNYMANSPWTEVQRCQCLTFNDCKQFGRVLWELHDGQWTPAVEFFGNIR